MGLKHRRAQVNCQPSLHVLTNVTCVPAAMKLHPSARFLLCCPVQGTTILWPLRHAAPPALASTPAPLRAVGKSPSLCLALPRCTGLRGCRTRVHVQALMLCVVPHGTVPFRCLRMPYGTAPELPRMPHGTVPFPWARPRPASWRSFRASALLSMLNSRLPACLLAGFINNGSMASSFSLP